MKYKFKTVDDVDIVTPHGMLLGGAETEEIQAKITELDKAGRLKLLFDLGETTFMSSLGLSVLFLAHAKYSKRGGVVKLCRVDRRILQILTMVGLTLISGQNIHETMEEALASFRGADSVPTPSTPSRIREPEKPRAVDESKRLEALRAYRILDTDPEQAFDDLTILASQICDTPIALISIVDEKRLWIKSRVGINAQETSRDISFCARAIEQEGLFIVPDALGDARFRENPLVLGDPRIRFYAGAPLMTRDGDALGTLCVIDREPRSLSDDQLAALRALRRQAEAQLELRRNLAELRLALEGIERLGNLVPYCSTCEMNMVIPADFNSLGSVSVGIHGLLEQKGWSEDAVAHVELALQEALSNAIRHGCNNDSSKKVQCSVSFEETGEIVIVVRDPGPGFDPKAVPSPIEAENLLKPGGRGVFLINQLMDTVEFTDEGRQVVMRKQRAAVA